MIILLDTATPVCRLTLARGDERSDSEWEAGRELSKGLLGFIETQLAARGAAMRDISGIGVFKGPGSFTGLRIGLAVCNTLADALLVPIVGATGADWQSTALVRLEQGENDQIVLPLYGRDAHITLPRK